MKDNNKNPVVSAAKDVRENKDLFLPDGTHIKILPVSAALVDAVMSRIKDPPVPVIVDKESGQTIENRGDPNYLAELQEVTRRRTNATIDAFVMFGIDLPEGFPTDGAWINKLKYLIKLGHISIDGFDMNDPVDLEFLYKRFIVANSDIINRISTASGVSGEEIEAAEASFRGS